MNPFIGEIRIFSFDFTPVGWLPCEGQLEMTSKFPALFDLLGYEFGGNGSTTFGIPDLRGRAAIHMGHGRGLSTYVIGQKGGEEVVALTSENLPPHVHKLLASTIDSDTDAPTNGVLATARVNTYASPNTSPPPSLDILLAPNCITPSGKGKEIDNLQPYLSINYCIAYDGVYPSH